MSWSSIARTCGVAAIAAMVASCGFQLAQPTVLPAFVDTVRLQAEDTRSDLYLALEREFISRGIAISDDSNNLLDIGQVQSGQRVLSVSARNIPREYEVFYTVSYQFRHDGELLVDRPAHTLTRDYVWNELEVLGKAREEQQVRETIVGDLVADIMRQLSTL